MNSITKLAIKEVFGTYPNDAIMANQDRILCPHPIDIGWITDDCESPTSVEHNIREVRLKSYRCGDRLAIIGQCPKCDKVYYME